MSEPFLGQITVFPYNFAPHGWADCAGQLLPISQYSALFSLLGVQYGGNGTSNFALPNLQGRVPVGQGQAAGGSTYIMGEASGVETVAVTSSTMPLHSHSLNATNAHGASNEPSAQLLATPYSGTPHANNKGQIYNTAVADTALAPNAIAQSGGSQPHNNIQPTLVLRYCIALQGVFPTRS
jgi:microcystin-dependent protein